MKVTPSLTQQEHLPVPSSHPHPKSYNVLLTLELELYFKGRKGLRLLLALAVPNVTPSPESQDIPFGLP